MKKGSKIFFILYHIIHKENHNKSLGNGEKEQYKRINKNTCLSVFLFIYFDIFLSFWECFQS